MHILGISGSLKSTSSNSALLRAIAIDQPDHLELWDRLGDLPHFSPELEDSAPVASLRHAVAGSDAVLIATPEYAGGMPGSLKNALDWLVGGGELYGKPIVVLSAAPSAERGHNARRWVEEVVRMQGGRIVASFTVATAGPGGGIATEHQARATFRRVMDALDQDELPVHGSSGRNPELPLE